MGTEQEKHAGRLEASMELLINAHLRPAQGNALNEL